MVIAVTISWPFRKMVSGRSVTTRCSASRPSWSMPVTVLASLWSSGSGATMNSGSRLLSMRSWPQRRYHISSGTEAMQGVKIMVDSVYKVIELVGTSSKSWEDAARAAVERAAQTLRDLRVAEVVQQDLVITDGKVEAYRSKLKLSFKYEGHD